MGELAAEPLAERVGPGDMLMWPRPSRFILKSGREVGAIMDYTVMIDLMGRVGF